MTTRVISMTLAAAAGLLLAAIVFGTGGTQAGTT